MSHAAKDVNPPFDDVRHVSAICNKRRCVELLSKQVSFRREWLFLRFLTGPMYAVSENRLRACPAEAHRW